MDAWKEDEEKIEVQNLNRAKYDAVMPTFGRLVNFVYISVQNVYQFYKHGVVLYMNCSKYGVSWTVSIFKTCIKT